MLEKGGTIDGVAEASLSPDVVVFHAATVLKDGRLIAHGDRVLNIAACGETVRQTRRGLCRH